MSARFEIKVTLPVFKALTARLEDGMSHDDVLRQLLNIDSIVEPEPEQFFNALTMSVSENIQEVLHERSGKGGFYSRGLWLPNGTDLRARYKQKEYLARIVDNAWLDERGKRQSSPSGAASAITGNNVNGLRFWEARRPGDTSWRRLEILAQQQ
jgi:hypothetical protein